MPPFEALVKVFEFRAGRRVPEYAVEELERLEPRVQGTRRVRRRAPLSEASKTKNRTESRQYRRAAARVVAAHRAEFEEYLADERTRV